jgi:hypothetical protein
MTSDELMQLAPDLQALLRDEQAAPAMPAALQASVASRLAESMATNPGVPEEGAGDPGTGDPSAAAGTAEAASLSPMASLAAKPALLAATAFGIGIGAGVAGTTYFASESESGAPQPALVQHVSALDAGPRTLPTPDARAMVVVSIDAGAIAVSPPPTEKPKARSLGKDKDLAAERSLLELSRTAITRGDAPTALVQLEKHARLFRRGRLAEERDALWVQALALARSYAQARSKAAAFKKKYPKSLFLPVIDHALKQAP